MHCLEFDRTKIKNYIFKIVKVEEGQREYCKIRVAKSLLTRML